jgi:hypothetical protein
MKRFLIIAGLLFLLLPIICIAADCKFMPGVEPDGFRENRWGTDISAFGELKLVMEINNEVYRYEKINDNLKLGEVNITRILYDFKENKFIAVTIITNGIDEWQTLKASVHKRYGNDCKPESNVNEINYRYKSMDTELILEYWEEIEEGLLEISTLKN